MSIIKAFPIFEEKELTSLDNYDPLKAINIQKVWKKGLKGKGTTIAVLDTGIDISHPEFNGRIIGGANFTEEDNSNFNKFKDYNGHGTHVAGIISTNNSKETTSVAPEANLFIGKILDKDGTGTVENLINAIYYAINWRGENNEKVRALCLSLGTKEKHKGLYEAVKYATTLGVPIIAASGNDRKGDINSENLRYPSSYNESIQVGAMDKNFNLASFSNINENIDLLAPGVGITSTFLNGKYKSMSGTSMASPFVAGAIAIIIQQIELELGRELTGSELYAQLIKHTKKTKYPFKVEGNGILTLENFQQ